MKKILNQIVFYTDFLLKNGQLNLAIFIKKNNEKIAYFFKNLIGNTDKKYLNFRTFNDKYLYLFFRENKNQKGEKRYLQIEQIEKLKEPTKTIYDEVELKLEKL